MRSSILNDRQICFIFGLDTPGITKFWRYTDFYFNFNQLLRMYVLKAMRYNVPLYQVGKIDNAMYKELL